MLELTSHFHSHEAKQMKNRSNIPTLNLKTRLFIAKEKFYYRY